MYRSYKIVVLGPESTGKSTLCAALAKTLNTGWVPEYARRYLEGLGREYVEEDLYEIAKGQIESETRQVANQYLIFDTDLYVIKVWSEAKYNRCHTKILQGIAAARPDLYLLTGTDIPWTADPLREHPLPAQRDYFFAQYKDIVVNSGTPFAIISGNEEARLAKALLRIQELGIGN